MARELVAGPIKGNKCFPVIDGAINPHKWIYGPRDLVDKDGNELDLSAVPEEHFVFFLAERWDDDKFYGVTYIGETGNYIGNFICLDLMRGWANRTENYIQLHPDTPEVGD